MQNALTPRWVKVFGAIAIALILVFVRLHLTGHGMKHMHGTDMQNMDDRQSSETPPRS